MANEIRTPSNVEAQDLKQTREQYLKKRRALVEGEEKRLEEIRSQYDRERSAVDAEGRAAVNHTRKKNQSDLERVSALQAERTERVKSQNDAELSRIKAAKARELDAARLAHEEQTSRLKAMRQRTQAEEQALLAHEREGEHKEIQAMRQKSALERERMKAEHDREMQTLSQRHRREQEGLQTKGSQELERTRMRFEQESQKLHQSGDAQVKSQRERMESDLAAIKASHQKQRQELLARHENERVTLQKNHEQRIQEQDQRQTRELQKQRLEFEKSFAANQIQNQETLEGQHDRLVKAINQQKRAIVENYARFQDRSHDPFYRMVASPTRLIEEPHHFVVETEVPEHEKDNIAISVKHDKVIVSGKRQYGDHLQEGERKISTNAYQTFREEIALDAPVAERLAEKSYQNGVLSIRVPKLGKA